jgi:hypothetical protein
MKRGQGLVTKVVGPKPRQGSSMSAKQISRAAVDNRKLAFNLIAPPSRVAGYVVGMDDYHWLVAQGNEDLLLVHKGSAATVEFLSGFLSSEDTDFQEYTKRVGASFWDSLQRGAQA